MPWVLLLSAGIALLAHNTTSDVVLGSVVALCGLPGRVTAAQRYRPEPHQDTGLS